MNWNIFGEAMDQEPGGVQGGPGEGQGGPEEGGAPGDAAVGIGGVG